MHLSFLLSFSCSVVSDSFHARGLQQARLLCPSPSPRVCSMSTESVMPSSHLLPCCCLLLLPSIFPSIRIFSNESALCIRWPKHWSFSFSSSPSNEYSGLISFRIDWFASPRDSQESSPTPQFKSINSPELSFLYSPTLTSIHDHWKNHSFEYTDLCWQKHLLFTWGKMTLQCCFFSVNTVNQPAINIHSALLSLPPPHTIPPSRASASYSEWRHITQSRKGVKRTQL